MAKTSKKTSSLTIQREVIEKLQEINKESGYFALGLIYRTKAEWDELLRAYTQLGVSWGEGVTPGGFEESEAGGNLMIYISVADGKTMIKYNFTTSYIDRPDLFNYTSSVEELMALISGDFSVIPLSQCRILLNKNGAYYILADSPGIMVNRKFGWDTLEYTWDFKGRAACKNTPEALKALKQKFPHFTEKSEGARVLVIDFGKKQLITTDNPPPSIIYNPIEELDELLNQTEPPLVAKLHEVDIVFIGKSGYECFHDIEAGNPIKLPDFYEVGKFLAEYKRQIMTATPTTETADAD